MSMRITPNAPLAPQANKDFQIADKAWFTHFFKVDHTIAYPAFDDASRRRDIIAWNLRFSALREFLRYEDRNYTAASIESTTPFKDYRLREFAFKVPDHLNIKDGMQKVGIRTATSAYNGQTVLGRIDK